MDGSAHLLGRSSAPSFSAGRSMLIGSLGSTRPRPGSASGGQAACQRRGATDRRKYRQIARATTIVHRDLVIALAARHNLPAVYALRVFVTTGGLMSYSTELDEAFQQAASLVDHILRGAKPIELPVQTPTKYQTSLNLKTAKALGLTVPSGLLVAADEVIE